MLASSPRSVAQRATLQRHFGTVHAPGPPVPSVQREIDTDVDDLDQWTPVEGIPDQGFDGLPPTASKTVTALSGTTAPYDPSAAMADLRDKGYLRDPAKSNGQTLTRMHAIRGRFGGPSAADNMFLGTAPSNNFHDDSHYRQVEKPLQDYLSDAGDETRAFDYRVTPNTNDIPGYMQDRIDALDDGDEDKDALRDFANDHVPNGFRCDADLYYAEEDEYGEETVHAKAVSEDVSTTVNADQGTEDSD